MTDATPINGAVVIRNTTFVTGLKVAEYKQGLPRARTQRISSDSFLFV